MRRAFEHEKKVVGKIMKVKTPGLLLLEDISFEEFHFLRRLSGKRGKVIRSYTTRGSKHILGVELFDASKKQKIKCYVHEDDIEYIKVRTDYFSIGG